MSIWLLPNTAGHAAALIEATDTSGTSESDQSKVGCIRGGPRHLKWTSEEATAAARLAYVESTNGLTADFCVIVDAADHNGKAISIRYATTYPGTTVEIDSDTLSTYVGSGGTDYVNQFSKESSREAFILEFSATDYQKTARQVYFCEGLEFVDLAERSVTTRQRVSVNAPAIEFHGHYYKLWGRVELTLSQVPRADLDTYLELPKYDPVFFYDDSGSSSIGNTIDEKLWHALILEDQVKDIGDDIHEIKFVLGILRHW